MADRYAHGMVIGTVKGLDLLYEFYVRGISPEPIDDDWAAVKLPATVTNIINQKELAELKHSMSEEAYNREMLCDFFAENPEVLITPKEAREAQKRVLTPQLRNAVQHAQVVFGVDVGRTGDPSVVYKRQGLEATCLLNTHDPDNMSVADKVSRLIKIHRPTTVFVDAGQGQGVIDRLYRLNHEDTVVEIAFNAQSPEKSCVNMRAAMYYRVKKFLAKGVIPDDQLLLKELVNQLLTDDKNNRIQLAPKKDIRARIGGSPNEADALALTFADDAVDMEPSNEEVMQSALNQYMQAAGITPPEPTYDPLTYMETLQ